MSFWSRLWRGTPAQPAGSDGGRGPQAAGTSISLVDLNDPRLRELLSGGVVSQAGAVVSDSAALRIAVAWRCINIITGVVATTPFDLKERVDERTRRPAENHPLRSVLTVKPNRWQSPSELKKLLQTWLLLRGNAYALKVVSRGRVIELIPMSPDRVTANQADDLSLGYSYTRRDGARLELKQAEVMHLRGLSLDGVTGLSVISYARESMGLAIQAERAGANLFKTGNLAGYTLNHPSRLSDIAYKRLRADLEDQSSAENAGRTMILEEGVELKPAGLSPADAQFLVTRNFQRTDIGMFFGVPPHLYGDTEKSTSWGTGIEQQNIGFLQYTMQNWFTTWEEVIARDLLGDESPRIYAHFNVNGLLRGDIKSRFEAYAKGRQWGWYSANDIRAKEDENPIEGGDTYLQPTNMTDAADPNSAPSGSAGENQ